MLKIVKQLRFKRAGRRYVAAMNKMKSIASGLRDTIAETEEQISDINIDREKAQKKFNSTMNRLNSKQEDLEDFASANEEMLETIEKLTGK